MDGYTAFGFGMWFGLTGPLALHVSIALLSKHAQHAEPSLQEIVFIRVLRFIGTPLLLLGMLGVAGVFGSAPREHANLVSIGAFVGLASYGVFFFLYRRMSLVAAPKVLSERDIWLTHWEMTRAAGRKTFLAQHTIMGCVIGFFVSVILYTVGPRVGEFNVGDFPWVLGVFAFFPLVVFYYARWTWNVSERQFHALRGDIST